MKIILKENIENLGSKGDIVNVAAGYGRNYLLPKKLAIEVTSTNMKMIEMEQASLKKNLEKARISYQDVIQKLSDVSLSFERKAGEKDTIFGSVSVADIKEALDKLNFEIEKKKILLKEPIKKLGTFTVSIKVFLDDMAEIKVQVVPEGGEEEVVKPVLDKEKEVKEVKKVKDKATPQENIPEVAPEEPKESPKEELETLESIEETEAETDKPKEKKIEATVKEKEQKDAESQENKEVVKEKTDPKPEAKIKEIETEKEVVEAVNKKESSKDEGEDEDNEKNKTSK